MHHKKYGFALANSSLTANIKRAQAPQSNCNQLNVSVHYNGVYQLIKWKEMQ